MITASSIATVIYAILLLIILVVNLLYFFQIFRYRLPGDASVFIVVVHVAIMIFILFVGALFMNL